MMSEGSEGDSSDVNGASEEWDDDVDVEGDGHPDPLPSRNWGLGMNVDVDIEMDASIEVDGRTRRVKKRKVRKKSTLEDPTHVNGGKDASAGASASTLKPRAEKVIDLGPLVGVKRGFRTREKAPMNGGWGGVELVPSSLKAFPEVRAEDPHVGDKGKGKMRAADGEWFRGGAHWCLSFFFASLLAFGWSLLVVRLLTFSTMGRRQRRYRCWPFSGHVTPTNAQGLATTSSESTGTITRKSTAKSLNTCKMEKPA